MYSNPFSKNPGTPSLLIIIALALVFSLPSSLSAQVKIIHATDSVLTLKKEGLLYCLPQTKLSINLQLSRLSHTKGLYAENAKDMLGIEEALPTTGNEYVIKGFTLRETAIPDPDEYYVISFRKFCLKKNPVLHFSPESFLVSLNKTVCLSEENEVSLSSPYETHERQSSMGKYNYHLNPNLFKSIAADTSRVPKYFFRVKPTDDPLIKGARDAAENLARIRENKINLMSGYQEIAYEQNTLSAMLIGLEAEEEKALSLFTGTTDIITTTIEIPLVPEKTDTLPIVIGHFSKTSGFSTNPTAQGQLVTLTLTTMKDFEGSSFKPVKKHKTKTGKGYAVREPAWVVAQISMDGNLLFSQVICLPQFGLTARLPLSVKEAIFDSKTGAVKFYR